MFLSRAILESKTSARNVLGSAGGTYRAHQLAWRFFPNPKADRDFLYRVDLHGRCPTLWLLSEREPSNLAGWQLETKPFSPRLKPGQTLRFQLRSNPTMRRTQGEHSARHDVVMNEKRERIARGETLDDAAIQAVTAAWLTSRASRAGFVLREHNNRQLVRADAYQQRRFSAPRRKRPISISTIDFSGELVVADVELFERTLRTGIGPAKGFGCGLLMIRPSR